MLICHVFYVWFSRRSTSLLVVNEKCKTPFEVLLLFTTESYHFFGPNSIFCDSPFNGNTLRYCLITLYKIMQDKCGVLKLQVRAPLGVAGDRGRLHHHQEWKQKSSFILVWICWHMPLVTCKHSNQLIVHKSAGSWTADLIWQAAEKKISGIAHDYCMWAWWMLAVITSQFITDQLFFSDISWLVVSWSSSLVGLQLNKYLP